jgi:hypothetical protein
MPPMGIASMVIGIVALVIGFVPFCGAWAIVPAFAGLILGIVDLVLKTKRKRPRGMAIAGVVLNPLAIIVVVAWWLWAISVSSQIVSAPVTTGFNSAWSQLPAAAQQQQQQQLQPMQPMQPMQPVPDTAQPSAPAQPAAPAQNP